MLSCFDFVRDFSVLSIAVRMTLAVVCGGIIGIEREYKRRPAGFRTHILICLGAAITTLTSQHIVFNMQMYTDLGRLGAQVVAGIGFIGAGTIIVTKRQRVKGLTTAAGLWTAAIIGLVCGAGFVECALFATLMVLVAELLLIDVPEEETRRLPSKPQLLFAENRRLINLLERMKFEGFGGYPYLQQSIFHYIYEQRYINAIFGISNGVSVL